MPHAPALFQSPPVEDIEVARTARLRHRFAALSDAAMVDLVADTVFHER